MDSLQIWAFHRRHFFLFLDSEKNIVSSSRNLCLKFGTGELSGTLCSENREKVWKSDIGGLGPAPVSLSDFYAWKPQKWTFQIRVWSGKKTRTKNICSSRRNLIFKIWNFRHFPEKKSKKNMKIENFNWNFI